MASVQKYFWACIAEDGTVTSEYNPDGSTNSFDEIPPETLTNAIYFGLTCANNGYFFDLKTGEYHFRDLNQDHKHPIKLPLGPRSNLVEVTGILPNYAKYPIYQYKEGHADFNMAFQSTGNIIDKHVIGYKIKKKLNFREYFLDVKLTLCPNETPVKPTLDVTLKGAENGPVIGVYTINV